MDIILTSRSKTTSNIGSLSEETIPLLRMVLRPDWSVAPSSTSDNPRRLSISSWFKTRDASEASSGEATFSFPSSSPTIVFHSAAKSSWFSPFGSPVLSGASISSSAVASWSTSSSPGSEVILGYLSRPQPLLYNHFLKENCFNLSRLNCYVYSSK